MSRPILFSFMGIAALFVALTSYIVTHFCTYYGYCVAPKSAVAVSGVEALSVAGLLVTVLAFVAAFAIVFMAIDAFAISHAITKNSARLEADITRVDEMEARIARAHSFVEVLDLYASEIDEAAASAEHIVSVLEIVEDRLSLGPPIKRSLLDTRTSLRQGRARLDGVRAIAAKAYNSNGKNDVSSAIPELLSLAQKGDDRSIRILRGLAKSGLLTSNQKTIVSAF